MTSLSAGVKFMAYKELRELGMPNSFQLSDRGPRSDAVRAAELRHPGLKLADVVSELGAVHWQHPTRKGKSR